MNPQLMIDRTLPLVDLHRHLDGNVRLETMIDLGRKHNLPLPAWEPEMLRPFVQVTSPQPSLVDFLSKFDYLIPAMVDYDAVRRIAYENVEDAHNEGICYVELRFSPLFVASGHGLDPSAVVEAAADGVAAAVRDTGVQARIIGIIQRHLGLESAERELEALLRVRDSITGVDLAGAEAGWPGAMFAPLFRRARDTGLRITVHAGEAAGPESIWDALQVCGAVRIGHGLRIVEDLEVAGVDEDGMPLASLGRLASWVRERQVPLELCPSSNVQTGQAASIAEHPITLLRDLGFTVTVNSDNRLMCGTSVSREMTLLVAEAGWTLGDLEAATLAAAFHAFASYDVMRQVIMEQVLPGFAAAGGDDE